MGQWKEGTLTTVPVALGLVHGHLPKKWSPGVLCRFSWSLSGKERMRGSKHHVQLHHLLGGPWNLFDSVSSSEMMVQILQG